MLLELTLTHTNLHPVTVFTTFAVNIIVILLSATFHLLTFILSCPQGIT